MDILVFAALSIVMAAVAAWWILGGEIVGSADALRVGFLGGRLRGRITVKRVGPDRKPSARLQASVPAQVRIMPLTRANALRCAELLERCAKEGRVGRGAEFESVGGVEIGPDFDGEEGRAVAIVFKDSESDMRMLLTPARAERVAGWLRKAVAPQRRPRASGQAASPK